jgi:hypothetical protein
LGVTIAKVQQSLPELKRDGQTVAYAVHGDALFNQDSVIHAGSVTTQLEEIPILAERLRDEPEAVIRDFNTIRAARTFAAGLFAT